MKENFPSVYLGHRISAIKEDLGDEGGVRDPGPQGKVHQWPWEGNPVEHLSLNRGGNL